MFTFYYIEKCIEECTLALHNNSIVHDIFSLLSYTNEKRDSSIKSRMFNCVWDPHTKDLITLNDKHSIYLKLKISCSMTLFSECWLHQVIMFHWWYKNWWQCQKLFETSKPQWLWCLRWVKLQLAFLWYVLLSVLENV